MSLVLCRMCDFHKTGTCMAKDLCRFAHQAILALLADWGGGATLT